MNEDSIIGFSNETSPRTTANTQRLWSFSGERPTISKNPEKEMIVILDNFSSHKAKDTVQCAEDFRIDLIYLPPYSPDPKSDRIHLEEHQESYLTEIYR